MNERAALTAPNPAYTLVVESPGKLGCDYYTPPALAAGEVRIATLYSGISAGTEMTAFYGSNPFLNKRWDTATRLFQPEAASWTYPMPAMGYEEVGQVVEVGAGVTKLTPGQIIWGTWRHRSEHIATEDWAAARILADGVDPQLGIFSQIGAIALNAILDAGIRLGEYVAIFGQGVPGLMVTQLAKLNGATVIAVDRLQSRLDLAKGMGADYVIDASAEDAHENQGDHWWSGCGPCHRNLRCLPRPAFRHPVRRLQQPRRSLRLLSGRRARAVSGRGIPPQPRQPCLLADQRHQPRARPPLEPHAA